MGPFGYGNLGDAATQDAVIQHLRSEYPAAEIVGFSLNPEDTEMRHGIKGFPLSWQSWDDEETGQTRGWMHRIANRVRSLDRPAARKLARLMLRAPREPRMLREAANHLRGVDVLIVSGGGQLEDYWGGSSFSYPYTFLKWIALARLGGARTFLMSVGAGPIDARLSKHFFRWGLALCEYRSYRDRFSLRLIQSIGVDSHDTVCPDLAFGLDLSRVKPSPRDPHVDRAVAVGPIGYFKKGCWPEHDEGIYRDYLEKMTALVKWLVAKNHGVVLLPGEVYYDQLAITDLLEKLRSENVGLDRIARPSVASVGDLLDHLSSSDIVVTSRFHGLLLAQALGKPGLGLSYQQKFDALMEDAGQSKNCFPIEQFELESVKESLSAIANDYEVAQRRTSEWAEKCRSAVNEQFRLVFAALSH